MGANQPIDNYGLLKVIATNVSDKINNYSTLKATGHQSLNSSSVTVNYGTLNATGVNLNNRLLTKAKGNSIQFDTKFIKQACRKNN